MSRYRSDPYLDRWRDNWSVRTGTFWPSQPPPGPQWPWANRRGAPQHAPGVPPYDSLDGAVAIPALITAIAGAAAAGASTVASIVAKVKANKRADLKAARQRGATPEQLREIRRRYRAKLKSVRKKARHEARAERKAKRRARRAKRQGKTPTETEAAVKTDTTNDAARDVARGAGIAAGMLRELEAGLDPAAEMPAPPPGAYEPRRRAPSGMAWWSQPMPWAGDLPRWTLAVAGGGVGLLLLTRRRR